MQGTAMCTFRLSELTQNSPRRFATRLSTEYFIRVRPVDLDNGGLVGLPSFWSAPAGVECPKGAYCGEGGDGVPSTAVKADKGFFRVPWAQKNLTFAACNVPESCLANETCAEGSTGPMCDLCQPEYTKAGGVKCRRCLPEPLQSLYVSGAVMAGIIFLAVMIFNALRQKGNVGDSRVGMLKAGLRYFQLAALAASFPLQWPPEVKGLFGFMDGVTSATSAV
jgi:hypothetical protein